MKWLALASGVSLLLSSSLVWADSITGTLQFKKKASFVGVIYTDQKAEKPTEASLDQKDKEFTEKLIVVSPDGKILFNNSDTFEHNIYANGTGKEANFDIGIMPVGSTQSMDVNWAEDTVTRIGCKIHPKMKSYIANISSSNFQVLPFSKKQPNYDIKLGDVAGDSVVVTLKIPKYDDTVVTLAAGEEKTVDVIRKGKVKATLSLKR